MLVLDAHTCDCVLSHRENTLDSFQGKCSMSMIVPSFFTATAYRSDKFVGSLSHTNTSPLILFYTHGSRECNFFQKNFSMAVTLSVRSSRLLCCKIFALKYFWRTSTLRKSFNTNIFQRKFHRMKIS